MGKKKEKEKEWKDYRRDLYETKIKSDDDFEKYITLISSGGLGLTFTFLNDIIPLKHSSCKFLIITGWFLLGITLFISLFSHYKSSINAENNIEDIDNNLEYNKLVENVNKRNSIIRLLNKSSIILLGLGIILITVFISLNISNGEENNTKPKTTTQTCSKTITFN